jgi:hypothetical protein
MTRRRRGKGNPRQLTREELPDLCRALGTKVRLGFTGSNKELTELDTVKILAVLLSLARRYPKAMWITGGCVGVDAMIALAGVASGGHVHVVLPVNHSQVDPDWQKNCSSYYQMPDFTGYMERNDEIVACSTRMGAAFPDGPEVLRSGTWATVRRFRKAGKSSKRIFQLDP